MDFVAKLNKKEMLKMAEMEGVVSVFPNEKKQLHTSRSWDFIGLTPNIQRASKTAQSDIIIGVIDTGLWPDSESFSDEGFGPPPKKWKGTCAPNFPCNNKIIGAKYYKADRNFSKNEVISPRDSNGHGTHTGSTAAGNFVKSASFYGIASGTARGGVPSARIAVYKISWNDGNSNDDADIMAAFDDAIADGVDIITISIGRNVAIDYFIDSIAIGAFHAMRRGVLVSASAGNEGPTLGTVGNVAPWLLSVAASTTDRKIFAEIQLGDKTTYEGVNINSYDLKGRLYPIIHGRDAPNPKSTSLKSGFCIDGSLDPKLGIIMKGDYYVDTGFTYVLPASHVGTKDGASIESYINKTRNPSATIFKSHMVFDRKYSLHVASSSSRGPNKVNYDILKFISELTRIIPELTGTVHPYFDMSFDFSDWFLRFFDILKLMLGSVSWKMLGLCDIAPGVDILAAWTTLNSPSKFKGDKRIVKYNIISGTSMACPHATGAAAYVKSFHPNWSPAAIRSALMTTGHIDPIKAINPGLIYDGEIDYIKFLCGQGYESSKLKKIIGNHISCSDVNIGTIWDLNYPSFAASTHTPIVSRTFTRTVTNVGLSKFYL
ncbi:cucumisin-like [Quillaja saponaria]|uniref:Cucumisin-like n=1 Tax=Quillaja saponaria TaxID=32244 RepID=A0AAD7LVQ8_QUISA|nr:cucumisin-like [Quillaja saponaria]